MLSKLEKNKNLTFLSSKLVDPYVEADSRTNLKQDLGLGQMAMLHKFGTIELASTAG
jgi:hypothetical protein